MNLMGWEMFVCGMVILFIEVRDDDNDGKGA